MKRYQLSNDKVLYGVSVRDYYVAGNIIVIYLREDPYITYVSYSAGVVGLAGESVMYIDGITCDLCGDPLGVVKYRVNDWDGCLYCSEYCVEIQYNFEQKQEQDETD